MAIKRQLKMKGMTVEKYKDTMETFGKNNDYKINHQQYDHCYAKTIVTDCVNDDCLAEIFSYVPICERSKIALVCKKWKKALDDSWFNVKKIELPYWRYHEYANFNQIVPKYDKSSFTTEQ